MKFLTETFFILNESQSFLNFAADSLSLSSNLNSFDVKELLGSENYDNYLTNATNSNLYSNFNLNSLNFINSFNGVDSNSTNVLTGLPSEFDYLNVEVRRRHKKFPHLTFDEVYEHMISPGSDGINMALRMIEDEEKTPINTSNLFYHNNEYIDVTKLSHKEVLNLSTTVDDIEKFEALEHIRSNYMVSSPNVKIYYPEPFIASASFMHNDIGFLHILQYQFWLWFLFIFLICFFFISFLCVVRWCANRTQPRRETRGVSRSKCGDLITATVPVTWAISIIVSESTDATDYYDGFGTGELIVGVRAYQWGWHYYYPKHADLNYNVKPNYSSFIGNSLKYNTTTGKKLNTNSLWKFYQSKLDDAAVSPAHLLVLPTDNSNILNLLSFKDIGIDMLQASKAFKQIRASSRVYTTNLVHTPSLLTDKYVKINNLYFNENQLINSNNFGLKRQHTLTSSASTTAINSTFLDQKSLNKFLSYTLQYNQTNNDTKLFNGASDLWSKKSQSDLNVNALTNLSILLGEGNKFNSPALKVLVSYPNIIQEFGDNSDNKPTNFPLRKLLKRSFVKSTKQNLLDKNPFMGSTTLGENTSNTHNFFQSNLKNIAPTSKEFMVNYPFQSIATGKQSVRKHKNLNENTTNYNLSLGINSLDSNLVKLSKTSNFVSPSYVYNLQRANWSDSTVFNKLASNRVSYEGIAPIMSNNPFISRHNFDNSTVLNKKTYYSTDTALNKWFSPASKDNNDESSEKPTLKAPYQNLLNLLETSKLKNVEVQDWNSKYTKTIQVLSGDRTGEDRSPTSTYWRSFWSGTNVNLRLSHILNSYDVKSNLLLPNYVDYYDYDFRNASAIRLFEDLTWESTYSGYNHLEYLNIYNKYRESYDSRSYKWIYNNKLLLNVDRDYNLTYKFGTNAKSKELSNIGSFYTNSIQSDDYFIPVNYMTKQNLSEVALANDLVLFDESYQDQKNLNNLFVTKSSLPMGVYNTFNYPQSHHAVLNSFRADFEDFSHFNDINFKNPQTLNTESSVNNDDVLLLKTKNLKFDNTSVSNNSNSISSANANSYENNPGQVNWSRFSNPLVLRRSAKSSMVTYQAYQKVFKLRYEEGRAHVRLGDFADSAYTQPYTTEQRIKYEKMLGKTKLKFYNTNLNVNKLLPVFNTNSHLSNSLNTYFYEFPFLEGLTNDPTRHVFFDAFIKFAQQEVSGSSVSKYTIVGVPFYKKKYDFNVKQGKQLAETELYFSRIATARKSYLPQWIMTPYLSTRSNVWYNESRMELLYRSNCKDLNDLRLNLQRMGWYWQDAKFSKDSSAMFTPSFSNSHRTTSRPYKSMHGYYYSLNTLTDILSRREYLYRQTLESRNKIIELPLTLRATPKHPLIKEIKSSFLLVDPITYNSEFSREFYYNSLTYFKFLLFKDLLLNLNSYVTSLPVNLKLVNEYLFFHFIDQPKSVTMGNREDMRKSQFKPLKKGISSMMRLQGSGAVAMPIEIRLQILASSKDVIHSWAIPSAGIKIDCIPGYTSHRIAIFFTPGIYWGQCMEICGRYHHWMPIILYFMKRDLFFLWCTHFLSKKDPYATKFWEANDKQFADYVGFVSYNKSTWLTELTKTL